MWFFSVSRNGDRGFMLAPPVGSAVLEKTARVTLPHARAIPAYANSTSSTASRISDPIMLTGEHRSSGLRGVFAYKPLTPSQQCACHTYKQPSVHDQDSARQGSHGFLTVPRPTCHRPQVIRFYPTGGPLQLKDLSCISFS